MIKLLFLLFIFLLFELRFSSSYGHGIPIIYASRKIVHMLFMESCTWTIIILQRECIIMVFLLMVIFLKKYRKMLRNLVWYLIFKLRTKFADKNIDVDEYLLKETLQWCCTELLGMGFDSENPPPIPDEDRLSPHRTVYLQLRERIFVHVRQQLEPVLALSEKLYGGFNWQPSSIDISVQQIDVINDEIEE